MVNAWHPPQGSLHRLLEGKASVTDTIPLGARQGGERLLTCWPEQFGG
jgi:hypothetical protein